MPPAPRTMSDSSRNGADPAPHERIVIVSASVGAGHDGAAKQLRARLTALGHPVEVIDFLDLLPGPTGQALRGAYRLQLRVAAPTWRWVLEATEYRTRVAAVACRLAQLAAPAAMRVLAENLAAVVSTYPLASQMLGRLRTSGDIAVPVITYLTDMSVHPLWVADGADAHLALHEVPAEQAIRHGAADVRVTGPAVAHAFRPRNTDSQQARARRRFGLPATGTLALVTAGSWGVGQVEQSARDITATGLATPVIACGGSRSLRARMESAAVGVSMGWVTDMPSLLDACDIVVQNAGGLTCLEALASGLPVISYRCLPGHGVANARALELAGWCPWARDVEQLARLLANLPAHSARPLTTSTDGPGSVIGRLATARATPTPGAIAVRR